MALSPNHPHLEDKLARGFVKAQLKLGYPSHSCTLDTPRGRLRGLDDTAHENSCSSLSTRRAGDQEEKGRGGEINGKINPETKPLRWGWGVVGGETPGSGPTSELAQGPAQHSGDTGTSAVYAHSLCHQMLLLRNSLSPIAYSDLTHINTEIHIFIGCVL